MKNKRKYLAVLSVFLTGFFVFIVVGLALADRILPRVEQYLLENRSLKVGAAAPDFELTSLNGETIRLSQFKGQPVLLSIGASWCPDCRLEAPLLQKLHEEHPELVVLMVDSGEERDVVQGFADEFGMTFPVLLDQDEKLMELYQVFAIPTNYFLDADGMIRAKLIEQVSPDLIVEGLLLIGISQTSEALRLAFETVAV
jgi:peroxiredoxin